MKYINIYVLHIYDIYIIYIYVYIYITYINLYVGRERKKKK